MTFELCVFLEHCSKVAIKKAQEYKEAERILLYDRKVATKAGLGPK